MPTDTDTEFEVEEEEDDDPEAAARARARRSLACGTLVRHWCVYGRYCYKGCLYDAVGLTASLVLLLVVVVHMINKLG